MIPGWLPPEENVGNPIERYPLPVVLTFSYRSSGFYQNAVVLTVGDPQVEIVTSRGYVLEIVITLRHVFDVGVIGEIV